MIIVPTITSRPQNVQNLIPTLKNNGRNTTYFWDSELAIANPKLLQKVSAAGDIGVIMDVGYIEDLADTSSKLYDRYVQYSSLQFAKDTIFSITKKNVTGLMPLYGYYDENTIRTMLELDYNVLITDSLTDRSVPKIEIRDDNELFVITKTARDDIEVIGDYGLTNIDYQRYTYEEDIDRLLIEGGLYVLKVHSNYQMKSEYVSVIKDIYSYVSDKKVWVTTIPELISWWKKKSGLEVRYETRSQRRITVEVSNPKQFDMRDFIVQVNLNKPVRNIEISSDIINPFFKIKLPDFEFDTSTNILYLYIDELGSGETRIYLVDFENMSV
jgi:peptidoglycan/xylan/chitin deacetylase (PgdA/CDA1 family)